MSRTASTGVLHKAELERRVLRGELIRNYRTNGGHPDLQPASYDLTAGRAVWSDSKGERHEQVYKPDSGERPFVVLAPGQMMSIITHEELVIPPDLCAAVFSKNRLAMNGIFAFNAGHVDPGFEGPIVIRLINFRAKPYTVTLGDPIFTIIFQTLTLPIDGDVLSKRPRITMEETLTQVRQFADVALSNALFDLYSDRIKETLDDHRSETLAKLREELAKEFVRREKFGTFLIEWGWKKVLILVGLTASIAGIMRNWSGIADFISRIFGRSQ
jgi:deoxycytidine triphosphate deaminase